MVNDYVILKYLELIVIVKSDNDKANKHVARYIFIIIKI